MADDLDPVLKRAFAEAVDPRLDGAADPGFLARVRAGVTAVERRRRALRVVACALFALGVIAITPWVAQFSLVLVRAAVSPAGLVVAVGASVFAAAFALKRGLA